LETTHDLALFAFSVHDHENAFMTDSRPLALVTGASRGIGAAIAVQLATDGFDLALTDIDPSEAGDVCSAAERVGARARLFASDVARLDQHASLLDDVLAWRGRPISCLVNNAGIGPEQRCDLLDMSVASFDRVLGVNLRGTFFLTQAVARHMATTDAMSPRTIVSISSVSAEMASPERGEYCVSKSGIAMLTKLFALRLAPLAIGVFEVRPGVIQTAMTERVADQYTQRIENGLVPAGRWGVPLDIAGVVASLASGRFAFSTGSIIHVDGALSVPRL
jgi:NAD(P)-dependent dehydrogenase (short-subunit alcohol dehydrogenase family)